MSMAAASVRCRDAAKIDNTPTPDRPASGSGAENSEEIRAISLDDTWIYHISGRQARTRSEWVH